MNAKVNYLPDGRVELNFENGDYYVGELKDGKITGKGRMVYKNNKIYEGEFLDDKWNGFGKAEFFHPDGKLESSYEGNWVRNLREGHGREIFYDNKGEVSAIYDAEYKNDHIDGPCVSEWANGDIMEAVLRGYDPIGPVVYRYGKKRGLAASALAGWVYEGPMYVVGGKYSREGHGKLRAADGTVYEGEFKRDDLNGRFTITYLNGTTETAIYVNGVRSGDGAAYADIPMETEEEPKEEVEEEPVNAWRPEEDDDTFLHVQYKGNDKYPEELQPYFKGVIGMEAVKDQLDKMYKRFKIDKMRQESLGLKGSKQGFYFIITGNPGTGKTTVARIIGKMLRDLDLLPGEVFVEVDRGRLVGQYIGATAIQTTSVIDSARGGTLFIDEAYNLFKKDDPKDFGVEAVDTLLKDMEDHRGEYCCILAGYKDRMDEMIKYANPGLASRFDHKIHIDDYSAEEILDILVSMADGKHFYIKKEAAKIILSKINTEQVDDTFDNARCARRLLDAAIERQALRLSDNIEDMGEHDLQILEASDFGKIQGEAEDLEGCLEELDSLVGLTDVKAEINSFVQAVKVQNESRKRGLSIASNPISLNMVFTGNAGTGKTTVARLLSKIYFHLGLLKRPDVFIECTRADLVGRYQGETAIKVKDKVRSALGGILFIDEAYALVNGDGDSFGQEAVNTLVSEIENNRENLAVILAGYTTEMEEFLNSNSGLKSRLPRVIEFPDYDLKELMAIFRRDLQKRGYEDDMSDESLEKLIAKGMERPDFGNARGARNLVDKAIEKHNARMNESELSALSNDDILSITDEDLKI